MTDQRNQATIVQADKPVRIILPFFNDYLITFRCKQYSRFLSQVFFLFMAREKLSPVGNSMKIIIDHTRAKQNTPDYRHYITEKVT